MGPAASGASDAITGVSDMIHSSSTNFLQHPSLPGSTRLPAEKLAPKRAERKASQRRGRFSGRRSPAPQRAGPSYIAERADEESVLRLQLRPASPRASRRSASRFAQPLAGYEK